MSIRLVTLGALRCVAGGQTHTILLGQRQRLAVLIYLAVEQETTRDQVLSVFWPERDTEKSRQALNQALFELRRALGDDWLRRQGDHLVVTNELEIDTNQFEAALDRGALEDAFQLYRGEFLKAQHLADTNSFEVWVSTQRAHLARRHRKARIGFVDELVVRRDLARAVQETRRWVELDPMEDEAQHRLIELLAERGERAEALRQYEAYARLLQSEELEPLDNTKELVERIRAGQIAGVGPPPIVAASPSVSPAEQMVAHAIPTTEAQRSSLAGDQATPARDRRLEADLSPEFEILREIGQGWMAHVYLARERALQRLVAVKVLRPELANDETARARFEREARSAAKLVHPNVVAVHRVGTLKDGTPYIAMEYVEGRNLADTLAAEGALTEAEARSVLGQLASALAAAHAHGIIHRDVRPANICWTREAGRVVLMDFGIAAVAESGSEAVTRLTKPGEVLGDVAYMSPEQLRGETVSAATDIFSLGVIGYEILTLGRPFKAEAGLQMTWAQLNWEALALTALRPDTSQALSDLMLHCLAKKPVHRPSAAQLARSFAHRTDEETPHLPGRTPQSVHDLAAVTGVPAVRAFLDELKRRSVYNVAIIYAAVAFFILQGADLILPELPLPAWFYTALVVLVIGGFPVAMVLAWIFDTTSTGIQRTEALAPDRNGQRALQFAGLGLSLLLAGIIGWWILTN